MYYKDLNNKPHVIEPKFANLLPAGSVPITEQEYAALIAPTPEQLAQFEAAQAQAAQDRADAIEAKADAKLLALSRMAPLQVRAWVAANVTNLADAKDVLATLAVCVSVLARRL